MSEATSPKQGGGSEPLLRPSWRPFEEAAASYDLWYESALGAFADRVQREAIFGLLELRARERVLDIGCGTGRYTLELARLGGRAMGVDPAVGMLTVAAERRALPRGSAYLRAVGERLPFGSNAFDAAIIVVTLEFVTEVEAVLAEAARVIRPGGRLVVGVLNRRGPWARRRRRSRSPLWAGVRFFDRRELEAKMGVYGPVRSRLVLFVPPQLGWLPSRLLGLIEVVGARLARPWGAFVAMRVDIRR